MLTLAGAWAPLGIAQAQVDAAEPQAKALMPRPKLVVAISIDQFSSNLFGQWRSRYTAGLKRLGSEGIVYANGYQTHGATETCPGHSTILTGRHPKNTGIIANGWYDTATGKDVYCIEDHSMRPAHAPDAKPEAGRSTANLKATTLGDWLKAQSPASRIVAVSGKDRGALNMGGHRADGAFWFEDGYGFTTSVPAGQPGEPALAPLATFNRKLQEYWRTNPPVWTYADAQCRALETTYTFEGKPWQAQVPPQGWEAAKGEANMKGFFRSSPFLDEVTLDAARVLTQHYKLGRGPAVDVLAVSLSATDYVGHRFGTAGPEMCDHMMRLDRMLGAFLDDLETLGVPFIVVLTADHGGMDFPERLAAEGFRNAGRITPAAWLREVNGALRSKLGLGWNPLTTAGGGGDINQLYVVDKNGKAPSAKIREKIMAAAVEIVSKREDVAAAYGLETLLNTTVPASTPADELTLQQRMALSTAKGRSGDVTVAFRPLLLPSRASPGRYLASHGSVWDYDRRVPILFWWPKAPAQERPMPIPTVDIAPTLAHVIGIQPDKAIDGQCRDLGDFGSGACPAAGR